MLVTMSAISPCSKSLDESATQIRIRPAIFTARFMTHTSGKNRIVTHQETSIARLLNRLW